MKRDVTGEGKSQADDVDRVAREVFETPASSLVTKVGDGRAVPQTEKQ